MFTLTIMTTNQTFDMNPGGEVARILANVAGRLADGVTEGTIMDLNGNRVGSFTLGDR